MNKTAVIVWGIAIFICFLFGLIGLLNKGSLVEVEDPSTTTNVVNSENSKKTCTMEDYDSKTSYIFTLDENNYISNITVTYSRLTADEELYNKANELNQNVNIAGLKTALNWNNGNFSFMAILTMDEFDNEAFANYQDTYRSFDMLLDKNTDYSTYSSALSGFTCN